jgi:predicted RNA-binding protein with PUA-like domain
MATWLVKSEPEVYAFDQLVAEGRTFWNGVRNAQARNNLASMRLGDRVLYYHSNEGREIVGIATVVAEAYPDPTSPEDPRWVVVDLAPAARLARPVGLAECKGDALLQETALVRQGRLSVMPVSAAQFERVLALAGGERPL